MAADLVVTLILAACVGTPYPDRNPKNPFDLYAKSVRESQAHNVSAIIDQRDPSVQGAQRIKLDRDRKGRFHKTVVLPFSMEGVESVDDGKKWMTVFPDEHEVQVLDSPLRDPHDEEDRLRLANKNYTFSYDRDSQIAGRKTVCLVATPKAMELATRRFFLDAETLYPLRLETYGAGPSVVEFSTVQIAFPASLPSGTFDLPSDYGMKIYQYARPKSFKYSSAAASALGFRPILPRNIELGFVIEEQQVSVRSTWSTLVLRLTDGLVRATVYEFSSEAQVDEGPIQNRDDLRTSNVHVMIVASMPEAARKRVLDSFNVAQEQFLQIPVRPVNSLSRNLEPGTGALALANLDKSSPLSGTGLAERFRRATEGAWTLCRSKQDEQ